MLYKYIVPSILLIFKFRDRKQEHILNCYRLFCNEISSPLKKKKKRNSVGSFRERNDSRFDCALGKGG